MSSIRYYRVSLYDVYKKYLLETTYRIGKRIDLQEREIEKKNINDRGDYIGRPIITALISYYELTSR